MAPALEDEGRCVEEDLVKSFFPSLFDSDSDSEDVYCLRSGHSDETDVSTSVLGQSSPQSSGMSTKMTSVLSSPITKANSTSLLHLSRCHEALPETGSPLSQENSSHTVFQTGPLEHSNSIGDQSAFHSVLSLQSSSSLFEIDSLDGSPLKKRRVDWNAGQTEVSHAPELLAQAPPQEAPQGLRSVVSSAPVFQQQGSVSIPHAGPASRPLCLAGSITTGVPVDSCNLPGTVGAKALPLGRAPPPHLTVTYSPWPAHTQPLPQQAHQLPQSQMMGTWRSPQAMIPTASAAPLVSQPNGVHKTHAPALEGSEKIAAALAEISKAPVGTAPLGLKLDKVGVMHQLTAMGMRVTGV